MSKLYVTRGLPGSGKTTYAKQWVEIDPSTRARVSRDDIRHNILNLDWREAPFAYGYEQLVTEIQRGMVQSLLLKGWHVIVDDTNLKLKVVKDWAALAKLCRAGFELVDFDHITVDICVQRDKARGLEGNRWVGSDVITKMHDRFLRSGLAKYEEEETVSTTRQYKNDPDLPPAYIFDIDGTLALMGDRSPFEWHKVGMDDVNEWVRDICHALSRKATILIMSGRDSCCRATTESWLRRNDIPYADLFMRGQGDQRKDSIVKAELFWGNVGEVYNVLGVFDDRNQVVDMWRAMGVKVAQVAPGDF